MNKLNALILAMAMALSAAFPATAYDADESGHRESTHRRAWSAPAVVVVPACDPDWEPDESDSLATEEKIAINHGPDDPRWFYIEDCEHLESTVWPCWSPDDGDFYEDTCDACGEVLSSWPAYHENECSHWSQCESEINGVIVCECYDCGAIIWTQRISDPYFIEDEEECPHESTEEFTLHENRGDFVEIVCTTCGEVLDGWEVPESDPNDLPDYGEEGKE